MRADTSTAEGACPPWMSIPAVTGIGTIFPTPVFGEWKTNLVRGDIKYVLKSKQTNERFLRDHTPGRKHTGLMSLHNARLVTTALSGHPSGINEFVLVTSIFAKQRLRYWRTLSSATRDVKQNYVIMSSSLLATYASGQLSSNTTYGSRLP